jgi:hypothetical protein
MPDESSNAAAERLRLALEMCAVGEAMMRQRLRREHPDADEVEIERRLTEWFLERPGAEGGDAVGRPASWPRLGR